MEVKDVMKENLNSFLDYFEKTYLGKKGRTGWLKGKYALELWNQYDNVLEGCQLSTNSQEGWHSKLRKSLETCAMYWTLIDELTDIEACTRAFLEEDLENGLAAEQPGSSRHKKEARIEARARLREVVTHIEDFEMTDYLK